MQFTDAQTILFDNSTTYSALLIPRNVITSADQRVRYGTDRCHRVTIYNATVIDRNEPINRRYREQINTEITMTIIKYVLRNAGARMSFSVDATMP